MQPGPATRPPLCAAAPLLVSLVPLMAGILAARAEAGAAGLAAASGIAAVLLLARQPRRRIVVAGLSGLAGFLLMRAHCPPPHPLWSELPPREATVRLRVEGQFNARKPGHFAGTGTILASDIPYDTVSGRPTAFYLEYAEPQRIGKGSVLDCRGVLTYLPAQEQADGYTRHLSTRGIFLNLSRGAILAEAAPPPPLERLRKRLHRTCTELLASGSDSEADPGRVLASMMLGDRSLLTDARMELYRRTGSFHLFAVSGLHVGSVALCLHLLGGLLRMPILLRLLPVLAGTWAYVWLTGSSPSALRAGIMVSCLGLTRAILRQPHLFPALVLSAWVALIVDPLQLLNLGFQLSYAVVASIVLIGLPLARAVRDRIEARWQDIYPQPRWLRRARKLLLGASDTVWVSLSAGMASMPLIVQHFGLFTPVGLLLGPLLNPLATVSVMAGCLCLLVGVPGAAWLAGWLALATWPAIRLMEWLLETGLRVPGGASARAWAWPPAGTVLLVAALALAWLLQRLRQESVGLGALACLLPLLLIMAGLATGTLET